MRTDAGPSPVGGARAGLRRYWTVAVATAALFALVFAVVEAVDIEILAEPGSAMSRGLAAAAVGVALLVADALLPVPSSVVMTLHGAMFGVGVGALLSMAGRVGAAAAGFAAGRSGSSLLERAVGADEHARSRALLARWGWGAIVLSRPVPLLAETVIILAGASRMSWRTAMTAAVLGSLPEALTYALAGAALATFDASVAIFLSLLVLVAAAWILARRRGRKRPGAAAT